MRIFLHFGAHHLCHRNTCPEGYYLCNIVFCHLFPEKSSLSCLEGVHLCLCISYLLLKLRHLPILDLGRCRQVSVSLCAFLLLDKLLHLGLLLPQGKNGILFVLPLKMQCIVLSLEISKLTIDLSKPFH